MKAVLALDGGNSKTDVLLAALDGTPLASGRAGQFHPQLVGAEAAVAGIAAVVSEVLRRGGKPDVVLVAGYLAGADLPEEERQLTEALTRMGWARRAVARNDAFAVLRAGAPEPRGVAVVCGAGINCVGLRPDGRTARFPALGRLTGDWGGGIDLFNEVIWWSVRAEDGRGPATALATATAAHFGRRTATEVALAVHVGDVPRARLHELVPVLFDVAAEDDQVACGIVARQADEIASMATVALRRLHLLETPTPVVLGGGVLAEGRGMLVDAVATRLSLAAPKAEPVLLDAPPIVGAALLALDQLAAAGDLPDLPGGLPAAERRLRTEFGNPSSAVSDR